ncbi:T9SS type A sorting domain-containing protein [bacterium]|nr:T9SS type A sorting domain-containing protein [bacterium]
MFNQSHCNSLSLWLSITALLILQTPGLTNSWTYSDLKGLDPWGDAAVEYADLIAVYGRRSPEGFAFRADLMNLKTGPEDLLFIAIGFTEGGRKDYSRKNHALEFDIAWDLLIRFSLNGDNTLMDTNFQELPQHILEAALNSRLDFVFMDIDSALFQNMDGLWQIQASTLNKDGNSLLDKTKVFSSLDSAGLGKLVLTVSNVFTGYGPHAVSWYDGFGIRSWERPGERRGFKYLLDSFENHNIPMVLGDMRLETFPANEYLEINDRIRQLHNNGLCDPLSTLTYGHFMCWQPEDVNTKALEMMAELRDRMNLPVSDIFFPYESMLTAGDVKTISDAGYSAIYGLDQYRYWFGWLDDWSDITAVRESIESLRKIHRINGIDFFFHTSINNYQGFLTDERWETIDWNTWSEYAMYEGTDEGLHLWWRRILLDMALDPDQEQFFTLGTDLLLTPWLYPDVIEWNIAWIAAHPWIEAVTFTGLLTRGWEVIDHGDLGLSDDELLIRYAPQGDMHYNAYFPWFYHGGVSDGHSPNIPAGTAIEAYSDFVPYLREGEKIPSGRMMGDDNTPESLIDETLNHLRAAPDNAVTDLAWLAWFLGIAEQTFHAQTNYAGGEEAGNDWGGQFLHPAARLRANYINQINKLTTAAAWADSAASGTLPSSSQYRAGDYDLDGEDEAVIYNDQVWCLFENDGGRLEYAFSWSGTGGPVQLVAPTHQHQLIFDGLGRNYESGEISALQTWNRAADGCFVEDFSYPVYTMDVQNDQLIAASPDGSVQKTITLEGSQVHADYELHGISQVNPGFGFTVNLMQTYSPDWPQLFQKIEETDQVGWQCTAGGQVTVDLSDPNVGLISMDAFSDSPANQEMQERISYDDYPNGHWFNFPYHTISTIGVSPFRITLSFSAGSSVSVDDQGRIPENFMMAEAFPNPFNPFTTIRYTVPKVCHVNLIIYDLLGREITTLVNEIKTPGKYLVKWNGQNRAAGIYLAHLTAGEFTNTKKLILQK